MDKKTDFEKLGAEAKEHRLIQGWSQPTFAKILGVSPRTIARLEKGESLGDLARVKVEQYLAKQRQAA